MKQKTAFITGNSRGLGKGISSLLLDKGYEVYGCSRKGCSLKGQVHDICCDLNDFDAIPVTLSQLFDGVKSLDLVVLNAGILGEIKLMSHTSVSDLEKIMHINVWSNKVILDWLLQSDLFIDQILLMSSGAAVLGNHGWSGYALSKASLNMLAKLYAHEFPQTHLAAIAPGLVDTQMMDYLCDQANSDQFPALKRIQAAKDSSSLLSPQQAAQRLFSSLEPLKAFSSGSFVDLRQIFDPEEYESLMKAWSKGD